MPVASFSSHTTAAATCARRFDRPTSTTPRANAMHSRVANYAHCAALCASVVEPGGGVSARRNVTDASERARARAISDAQRWSRGLAFAQHDG